MDVIHGATAGAALGGGGTMLYRAAKGGSPMPNQPSTSNPANVAEDADSGGIGQFLWDRKLTTGAGAAVGADHAIRAYQSNFRTGSYGNLPYSSPLNSRFMRYRPGIDKVDGTWKSWLGSDQKHTENVANRIRRNIQTWTTAIIHLSVKSRSKHSSIFPG